MAKRTLENDIGLPAHDHRGAGNHSALDGFGKRLLDFMPSQFESLLPTPPPTAPKS